MTASIAGRYYGGQFAGTLPVAVEIVGDGAPRLRIQGLELDVTVALGEIRIGERVGDTPRLLQLPHGDSVEILDNRAFDAQLQTAGVRTAAERIRRLENRWGYALFAAVAVVAAAIAFFRFGAPALAGEALRFIPPSMDAVIGADTLRILDRSTFKPSRLSNQRQAEVRGLFKEVTAGASPGSARFRLEARAGGVIGANAIALPSGIVVLTDELDLLVKDDDELRGVFAHEVGHLVRRHAMRMLVQGSASAILISALWGDVSGVSTLLTAAPTLLLNAAYSRDLEREADEFAFRWMREHAVDPARLGDLLQRLTQAHGADSGGLLANHPSLQERVRAAQRPR